jgi:nickel/cobalt exporter
MRRLAFLPILLALLLSIAAPAQADPLTGRGGPPEASVTDQLPLFQSAMSRLMATQREMNDEISAAFHDVEENGSRRAIVLILALAFFYGALHAIGPGHGKSVVASYFVANHARWVSGVVMGGLISLIQGASAIVIVGLLAIVLRWRQFDVLSHATLVEFVSYGLIAALGIAMLYRALTGASHHHGHGHEHGTHHDHAGHAASHGIEPPLNRRLILATGLTPCASAIIILLFALANEALGIGVAAVISLSVGMALTVSAIGVATVLGRKAMLHLVDRVGVQTHRLEQALSVIGAVVIVAASSLEMVGAWYRL